MRVILALSTAAIALLPTTTEAQAFLRNTADIPSGSPGNDSFSENVDFADVDLDGDWDAAFANGGNGGNDQNRIWINQGPGNLGTFVDETAQRFPPVSDQSRDIEFVDFDNDTDPDIFVSNTASVSNQSNRWWRNASLGSGIYLDESTTRWVDLGTDGSSVPASLVLTTGFIDWCCDSDFGDLDDDGDMDLVQSTYGAFFTGQMPSRVFLNDGQGNFKEFNPTGVQLSAAQIPNGTPALWAAGVQQHDTGNQTGAQADIATTALDVDLGDLDGDFDLDVLLGARDQRPRIFRNNFTEVGGFLARFTDVTGDNQNPGWLPSFNHGSGNYEQELGDFDGDGDLDLFGLNWAGFTDIVAPNNGAGTFGPFTNLSGSGADDNEGDFIDYDNDGDLDLIIANFSGQDRLYENDGSGGYTNVTPQMPSNTTITLDVDVCDVDGDGDYDAFTANDNGQANWYYENLTQTPDTHAPRLVLEPVLDGGGSSQRVVHVAVYDNAPYYVTWYNSTWLEVTDGGPTTIVPMKSSGGQIFRGVIPAGFSGNVTVQAFSEDEYGNLGASAPLDYDVGIVGIYCTGKASSASCLARIGTSDEFAQPVSGAGGYELTATFVHSFKNGLLFAGIAGPAATPFHGGTLCVTPPLKRGPVLNSAGSGPNTCTGGFTTEVNDGTTIPQGLDAGPGNTAWYQYFYRDPQNGAGSLGSAMSNAVQLDFH